MGSSADIFVTAADETEARKLAVEKTLDKKWYGPHVDCATLPDCGVALMVMDGNSPYASWYKGS